MAGVAPEVLEALQAVQRALRLYYAALALAHHRARLLGARPRELKGWALGHFVKMTLPQVVAALLAVGLWGASLLPEPVRRAVRLEEEDRPPPSSALDLIPYTIKPLAGPNAA